MRSVFFSRFGMNSEARSTKQEPRTTDHGPRTIPLIVRDHRRTFEENLYVYAVVSRRSKGVSIGLNLNPDKVCNFDCVYCQVDRTTPPVVRQVDVPRLLAELGASPGTCGEYDDGSGRVRNCRHAVFLPVASGEPAGLSDDTAGVDFGMIDYRLPPAGFVNPARYTRDFFHYASPVGYFVPELKAALEARLASYDGSVPRTAEPRTGAYMQDLPGTAQGIARFYREVIGAPASVQGQRASVSVGRDQQLMFTESSAPIPAYDGHHIQIYLADFAAPYDWLKDRNLITMETDVHEWRFQYVVDPSTLAPLFQVEHEVRSMKHPLFGRPLVNRNPSLTNMNYLSGQDAFRGTY